MPRDHQLGLPEHPALRALGSEPRLYCYRPPLSDAEKYRRAVAWFNGWRAEWRGMRDLSTATLADADGWIPYSGRRCPLEVGTRYECMRANGRFSTFTVDGQDFDVGAFWNHDPNDSEHRRQRWLVKYRVVTA